MFRGSRFEAIISEQCAKRIYAKTQERELIGNTYDMRDISCINWFEKSPVVSRKKETAKQRSCLLIDTREDNTKTAAHEERKAQ